MIVHVDSNHYLKFFPFYIFGSTLTDAVEKFCLFLQFMQSPETELDWNDSSMTVKTIQVHI